MNEITFRSFFLCLLSNQIPPKKVKRNVPYVPFNNYDYYNIPKSISNLFKLFGERDYAFSTWSQVIHHHLK